MRVVIVGSGAGGATAACRLAGRGMDVVVVEAGKRFKPLTRHLAWVEPLRRAGLLGGTERIARFCPTYRTVRSSPELLLVRGLATGGCTVVSCGNMVRAEAGLKEIGLDLTGEFEELERRIRITQVPAERWRPVTRDLFRAAEELGLGPRSTPKALDLDRCVSCGLCEVGCATGARWDSRRFLGEAVRKGCTVSPGSRAVRVLIEDGRARGLLVEREGRLERMMADVVVLAAGGIGTAQILKASGIAVSDTLWADLVLTVGGRSKDARQLEEPPMVWYAKRENHIIAPYLDVLSHWFHKPWRSVPLRDRVGVMIKLAEVGNGEVLEDGSVIKEVDAADKEHLERAAAEVQDLMDRANVKGPYVNGTLNGGHLGGTVPLTKEDVPSMHPAALPDGLWVADLSLLSRSQGLPTMLTTAALAMRVSDKIIGSGRLDPDGT